MVALGDTLKRLRENKGLSLRAVEDLISVSNAFLSQLESGRVKQPSPLILFKLSNLYEVPYEILMEEAGYPVPNKSTSNKFVLGRLGRVTPEEEHELQEYLTFLRRRNSKGRR